MEVKRFQIVKRKRLRQIWDRLINYKVIAVMWIIAGTFHLIASDWIWAIFCFILLIVCSFIERWRLRCEVRHKRALEQINKDLMVQLRKTVPWIFN